MTPGGWVSSMRVASSALTDSSSQTGWVWESRSNTLILLFNESYPESLSPPTPLQLGKCSWTPLPWVSSLADTQSEVSLSSAGGFQQQQEQHLHIRKSGVKSSEQNKMKMTDSPLHNLLLSGWRHLHHFLLHLYDLHHKRVNQLEEGRKGSSRWSRRRKSKKVQQMEGFGTFPMCWPHFPLTGNRVKKRGF